MENSFVPKIPGIDGDMKKLRKFYSQWSVNASKLIKQYAIDHSLSWFNTQWRNKSKEIPFYIRTKAPKSFIGNIWFASRPTNYIYAKSVGRMKETRKAIPKGKRKPVNANGKWFMPKKYKPDVTVLNSTLTESVPEPARFFLSKTSHNKTHKYKKPMLWFQNKNTRDVGFVNLKDQLSDYIAQDPDTEKIIYDAFEQTIENGKYLK